MPLRVTSLLEEVEGLHRQGLLNFRDDLTFPQWMPPSSALLLEGDNVGWARRYGPAADQAGM